MGQAGGVGARRAREASRLDPSRGAVQVRQAGSCRFSLVAGFLGALLWAEWSVPLPSRVPAPCSSVENLCLHKLGEGLYRRLEAELDSHAGQEVSALSTTLHMPSDSFLLAVDRRVGSPGDRSAYPGRQTEPPSLQVLAGPLPGAADGAEHLPVPGPNLGPDRPGWHPVPLRPGPQPLQGTLA